MNFNFELSSPAGDSDYDVIIIGGGPAGAAAAIYTARADLRTLVLDKGLTAGALGITNKISNYPGVPGPVSGAELVEIMRGQAESFGAIFKSDKVVGVELAGATKVVIGGSGTYSSRVLILATGSMGRTATVPGEAELLGRGVSYCATCDGAFFRDETVAVVGNNDEAVEEALYLTRFAAQVHLISPTVTFKARPALLDALAAADNIALHPGARLKAIAGQDRVEAVRILPRGGEESTIPVRGAFVYLQGGRPITDYLMDQLATSADGCLEVDQEMQTSVSGVYAVGDLLCSHIKQAVIAAADGVIAAVAADRYVNERQAIRVDWH